MSTSILNLDAVRAAMVRDEPYRHFIGEGFIAPDAIDHVEASFPALKNAGFLTLQDVAPEGAFARLLEELQGPELAQAVSAALGVDLTGLPELVTIMRLCPRRAGRIHTDGESKIATFLLYLNRAWSAGHAGAVRVLRSSKDYEDAAGEVAPLVGNVFGFLRSDSSWHGHLPFEGERRVVQLTWLASDADVARKKRNNALAQALKSMWPRAARPARGAGASAAPGA